MPHNTAYIDPPGMLQCVCCVFVCVCMCVNLLSCQPLLSRRGAHTPRGKANNAHQLHIQASAHTVQQFVSELAAGHQHMCSGCSGWWTGSPHAAPPPEVARLVIT